MHKRPVDTFDRHPLSAIWGKEDQHIIDAIAERLRAREEVPAIAVLKGEVVDGWHRVQAAKQAKVNLYVRELSEDDDLAQTVLNGNMLRRRMTAIEATMKAIETLQWAGKKLYTQGGDRSSNGQDVHLKNEDIASMCGVSEKTVQRARQELDPDHKAAREQKRLEKQQEREEQYREVQEAVDADERNRGHDQAEAKQARATLAAYKAADDNPHEAKDRIAELEDLLDQANAEKDKAWIECDRLKRMIDALQEQNAILRRQLNKQTKDEEEAARKEEEEEARQTAILIEEEAVNMFGKNAA